ncbi:MAG: 50S ribosomal protein L21 [Oscillospiraceae bacterium]|nr:50S ribosomal protein L21 [Oscillospiraceae bacterium]
MYAVIETGGKQYKVKEGDEIYVEKLGVESGEITFDKVIMASREDGAMVLGFPYAKGVSVTASLVKNGRAKKITVFTYKPKKGSKRKLGHRQPYSKIKIEAINIT